MITAATEPCVRPLALLTDASQGLLDELALSAVTSFLCFLHSNGGCPLFRPGRGKRPLRLHPGPWRDKDCSVDSQEQFKADTREGQEEGGHLGTTRPLHHHLFISTPTSPPGSLLLPSLALMVFLQAQEETPISRELSWLSSVNFSCPLGPRGLPCCTYYTWGVICGVLPAVLVKKYFHCLL